MGVLEMHKKVGHLAEALDLRGYFLPQRQYKQSILSKFNTIII